MKSCIQSLFSVKNDGNHKVLRFVGLKLKFRKKEKNFGQKYKKELDEAISLLRDKESKKVFKSRVKFLSEPYEKKKTKIHKSSYEEYLNPNVLLKKGDVIIDAGVSEWVEPTLEFSNIVGDDGMVVGFEPEPVCFEEAVEQLREKKNIKLYNCGLWNKKDTFEIAQNGRGSSLFWKPEGVNVVECSLVKLDDFLKEENISKVDFIKMDIEGAEPEALEGCVETLRAQKPNLAICVYHKPEHLFEIILYLNSLNLGYKFELGHHRENEYSTVLYATVV